MSETEITSDELRLHGAKIEAATDSLGQVKGENTIIVPADDERQDEPNPELEKRKARAEIIDGIMEHRDFTANVEIRATSDGKLGLTGYASTTETPYDVMDFTETISRGAFKRTLGEDPDVVLLINHEGLPLARTRSGTLTLSEDVRGLRVDAVLEPADPDVKSLVPKMERGDLTEMSFAFRATNQEWDEEYTQRTIREVSIHRGDVSMVTHGANTATVGTVSARSADAEEEKPEPEKPEPPSPTRRYLEIAKARNAKARSPR
jgi:HK97 family phage prohead protease